MRFVRNCSFALLASALLMGCGSSEPTTPKPVPGETDGQVTGQAGAPGAKGAAPKRGKPMKTQ
jgi:hypothetical protein